MWVGTCFGDSQLKGLKRGKKVGWGIGMEGGHLMKTVVWLKQIQVDYWGVPGNTRGGRTKT